MIGIDVCDAWTVYCACLGVFPEVDAPSAGSWCTGVDLLASAWRPSDGSIAYALLFWYVSIHYSSQNIENWVLDPPVSEKVLISRSAKLLGMSREAWVMCHFCVLWLVWMFGPFTALRDFDR